MGYCFYTHTNSEEKICRFLKDGECCFDIEKLNTKEVKKILWLQEKKFDLNNILFKNLKRIYPKKEYNNNGVYGSVRFYNIVKKSLQGSLFCQKVLYFISQFKYRNCKLETELIKENGKVRLKLSDNKIFSRLHLDFL